LLIERSDKIFITGHKGMVGSSIMRSFIKKGYKNIITVDRSELDLTDEKNVRDWFRVNKPDVVILAAAKVGGIMANSRFPVEFMLENLRIQNNVIYSSYLNKVKRFLFLGSSCIYPKSAKQPIREEELLQAPLEKTNEAYALAKISGIKLVEYLRKEKEFDGISLMPTNLYGKNDNYTLNESHVLPALIRKIYEAKEKNLSFIECWGTGKPLREFLYVDDLGDAAVFALENWDPKEKKSPTDDHGNKLTYLNVGTGKDISIFELSNMLKEMIGFTGEIKWNTKKPDGTYKKQLDVSRIMKLGWDPKVKLKDGIKKTIQFFIDERNNNSIRI
jgi:GDP-L-fucose synthase